MAFWDGEILVSDGDNGLSEVKISAPKSAPKSVP